MTVAAAMFGLLFFTSAWGKLDTWGDWEVATDSWFASGMASWAVRTSIPGAELVVVALLFIRPGDGLRASFVLLLLLSVGAAVLWIRAVDSDCGCFGALMSARTGGGLFARNAGLTIAAAAAAWVFRDGAQASLAVPVVLLVVGGSILVTVVSGYSQLRRTSSQSVVSGRGGGAS
jgi:hypothetical protein